MELCNNACQNRYSNDMLGLWLRVPEGVELRTIVDELDDIGSDVLFVFQGFDGVVIRGAYHTVECSQGSVGAAIANFQAEILDSYGKLSGVKDVARVASAHLEVDGGEYEAMGLTMDHITGKTVRVNMIFVPYDPCFYTIEVAAFIENFDYVYKYIVDSIRINRAR